MDNILIRNKNTERLSKTFSMVTKKPADVVENHGIIGWSYNWDGPDDALVIQFSIKAERDTYALLDGDALMYLEGKVAISIDGILQPYFYNAEDLAKAFTDHTVLGFEFDPTLSGGLFNYRIFNKQPTANTVVVIYTVGTTDGLSPNWAGDKIEIIDDQGAGTFGFTLPPSYNVSCVGAVPFAGAFVTSGWNDTNVTNGAKTVTITDTAHFIETMGTDFGIEVVELEAWPVE